jgi:hypothetical protein
LVITVLRAEIKSRIFIVAAVFLLLASACVYAAESTLVLEASITNPSADESQETDVDIDLPPELKSDDIVSVDGLTVSYDLEKKAYSVSGKVMLQPDETTFYRIVVKDVWAIPEGEFTSLRGMISQMAPESSRSQLFDRVERIRSNLGKPYDDVVTHIAAYRENRVALDRIREEIRASSLNTFTPVPVASAPRGNLLIWSLVVVLMLLVAFYFLFSNRDFLANIRTIDMASRRRSARLLSQAEVKCRVLPGDTQAEPVYANNISEGGISVSLERPCPLQSIVELQIRFPDYPEVLQFVGYVVWQRKTVVTGKKEYHLTGIRFAEARRDSCDKLKDYLLFKKGE